MKQIADLHIHSKYSRACSRDLTLPNIDKACRIKGVHIIGTGDFTFPQWFSDIKEEFTAPDIHQKQDEVVKALLRRTRYLLTLKSQSNIALQNRLHS